MEWTGPLPQHQFSFPPQSQAWQHYDDEDEDKQEAFPSHSMLQPERYAHANISPLPRPISSLRMFGNAGVTLQPLGPLGMPQLEETTEFQPFCLPQNPPFSDPSTLPPCIQPPQPSSVEMQPQLYRQLDAQFLSEFPQLASATESTNNYPVPSVFPGMNNFAEEERARGDRKVGVQDVPRTYGRTQPAPRQQGREIVPSQEVKLSLDKRKLCCVEGCKSQARAFNRCKRHGGSKRCSSPGCTKSVQSRGLCIRHGGGSRCQETGCTRASQSQGRCKMHGGGRPCIVAGCDKKAHLKRLCRKHGGGTKCCMAGCDKWAQRLGMCMTHSKAVGVSSDIGVMAPHLPPTSPGSSPSMSLRIFSDAV
ncbi:hypothetical protein V7S43_000752 [Phytophthora oleae]|uniref:WRKY19-like zinc finger domain-containing protein n=1 Tax=Phytophthora oleae TaxID=2107226 RepID=A0ABD3G9U0_9STRA